MHWSAGRARICCWGHPRCVGCERTRRRASKEEPCFPFTPSGPERPAPQGTGAFAAIERDGRAAITEHVPRCRSPAKVTERFRQWKRGEPRITHRAAEPADGDRSYRDAAVASHLFHDAVGHRAQVPAAQDARVKVERIREVCSGSTRCRGRSTKSVPGAGGTAGSFRRRRRQKFRQECRQCRRRCGACRRLVPMSWWSDHDGQFESVEWRRDDPHGGACGRMNGPRRRRRRRDPVPVSQLHLRTGMPMLSALSPRLAVMPEPGKRINPFGRRFSSSSFLLNGAAFPWVFQSGRHTTW